MSVLSADEYLESINLTSLSNGCKVAAWLSEVEEATTNKTKFEQLKAAVDGPGRPFVLYKQLFKGTKAPFSGDLLAKHKRHECRCTEAEGVQA